MRRAVLATTLVTGLIAPAVLAAPARADVIYSFDAASGSLLWGLLGGSASVSFDLSDAAAAGGGSFTFRQAQGPSVQSGSGGLLSLTASAPGLAIALGQGGGIIDVSLQLGASGQITASSFDLSNGFDTLALTGSSAQASGSYQSDALLSPCLLSALCSFSGHWTRTVVSVAEPPSLALLAAALIGLIGWRVRWRARTAAGAVRSVSGSLHSPRSLRVSV